MSLRLDNVIAVGVLLALCVAALAHGTVEFWSVAVLQILLAILVLLWGIKMMVDYKLSLTIPPFFPASDGIPAARNFSIVQSRKQKFIG
jgi:hypothetical protein